MTRGSRIVLLAVIGVGVFLAGLELMVTAVALPSILADLADPGAGSGWIQLRKASWIINGYLLVYILTMPMAGRLADLWGTRRLLMGALAVFVVGSTLAGAAQDLDQLIAASARLAARHAFAAQPQLRALLGILRHLDVDRSDHRVDVHARAVQRLGERYR